MKWINTKAFLLILPVLLAGTVAMYAQPVPLDAWGAVGTRLAATGWTLDNTADTPAGDAYLSGEVMSSNWTGIRAGFAEPITPTMDEALVVTGQFEIIGGEVGEWNPLRWGVYRHEDIGTLTNQYTDSAAWGYIQYPGTDSAAFVSNEAMAHGYLVTNQTGSEGPVGGNGGSGSAWAVNGGSWISTFSGGTLALGSPFSHAPRRAVMPEGMYDFAMSVQPQADGSTELRWYIFSTDQTSYWHAGVHTDTTGLKTDLNGFGFSFRPEVEGITGINLFGVQVEMGDPIEIPDAPFSAFYVDTWGAVGTRLAATGWTLDNDSTTLVGDAYLSGDVMSSNWTAIRGGFGQNISATLDEALIVRGEFEIFGGEVGEWNPLRWGLYQHMDIGSINYQYTDSAAWGYTENPGTDSAAFVSNEAMAYGYLVTNQTGSEGPVGGNGGSGSAWSVNGGSWISTFSGGTLALGSPFNHAPRRAVMPEGVYEFAMSVQPLADGTTEVRWYIFSDDEESYWHAGTHIDTTAQKIDFNGFAFSYRPEVEGITGINLYEVEIDRGAPLEIPDAPFSSFFVDAWGAIGTRLAATGWTLDNDSTTLVGDAYLSGDVMSSNWTGIRGGFGQNISATLEEALIVSGEFEIIGGEVGEWNPLRWGLFQHMDAGTLNYQFTDSAAWGYTENPGTDSAAFVSNEAMAYGYLVTNQTGSEGPVGGNGGSGSAWSVNGGSWISTFSGGTLALGSPFSHAPRRAVMPEGTYEFAMSVQPLADGTTEVRWYIFSDDEMSYWHAGTHIDTTAQKSDFNGFGFSYRPEVEGITGINLFAVEIDRGAPLEIPAAPFSDFYVDTWGFLGGKFGGAEGDTVWTLTPGELVGDVAISGEAATGWAAVAGSFGSSINPADEAVTISGNVILEGGGFEEDNSLRFGLFNMNLGSQDSTETAGFVFTGAETGDGYLFIPGAATAWADGAMGTAGGVAGGPWYDPAGEGAYGLSEGTATGTPTAGTYELVIKVGPQEEGNGVRVLLSKEDGSYTYEAVAIDGTASKALATTSFNSVVFGTNNSTTTGLAIEALEVTMEEFSPVAIEDEIDGTLPKVFALEQNYPNPFNPTTNIKFSLPEAADVQIAVFNMLGQRVMTLVNGSMQPGFHQVAFDAKTLASGMYVYRMKAGDFVSTRKMMLIE